MGLACSPQRELGAFSISQAILKLVLLPFLRRLTSDPLPVTQCPRLFSDRIRWRLFSSYLVSLTLLSHGTGNVFARKLVR